MQTFAKRTSYIDDIETGFFRKRPLSPPQLCPRALPSPITKEPARGASAVSPLRWPGAPPQRRVCVCTPPAAPVTEEDGL